MNSSQHLVVYSVSKFKDHVGQEQRRWTRIGVAFPNTKGGFSIKLELVPTGTDQDIVAMPPRSKEDEQ